METEILKEKHRKYVAKYWAKNKKNKKDTTEQKLKESFASTSKLSSENVLNALSKSRNPWWWTVSSNLIYDGLAEP